MKFSLKHILLKNWTDLFSLEKEPCDRIFLFVIFSEIHPKKTPYNTMMIQCFFWAILLCCHTCGQSIHKDIYLAMFWL